ncbi:MAG: hypothetical protein L3J00_04475 [Thiomicrorhabdus sp.]|nr:hypothetical protein [Thiomicrorhabdus sp.]
MNNSSRVKIVFFIVSFVILYLIIPDFTGVGLSRFCILINLVLLGYIAMSSVDVYEFYIGDKFSIGIQMYRLKSLKEDDSSFNIWHRRIAVVVRILLALAMFLLLFNNWICSFVS